MKPLCSALVCVLIFSGCTGKKALKPEEIYQRETAATLKSVADEMFANGLYPEAEKTYRAILEYKKDDPITPEVIFKLADTYHLEKKFTEEVDLYTIITEKYATQDRATDIFFRLGKIYHHRSKLTTGVIDTNDFKRAIDFYNRVAARSDSVQDAPILMESYYSLGEIYLALNLNVKSKYHFDKLIQIYPGSDWADKARKQLLLLPAMPVATPAVTPDPVMVPSSGSLPDSSKAPPPN